MKRYVALLRAVNVGGTGKLPMSDLRTLAEHAGFSRVRTYIASGNLLFESASTEAEVKAGLEHALRRHAGKPVGVLVRTAEEISAVLEANPFPHAAPDRAVVIFLDEPPPPEATAEVAGLQDEELAPGRREIYVHYRHGMAHSKLRIAAARTGTARNLNTLAKLAALAAG